MTHAAKTPTTFDPVGQCRELLAGLPSGLRVRRTVATGYGRKLFTEAFEGDERLGLPYLKIETDYTESDVEQLRTASRPSWSCKPPDPP